MNLKLYKLICEQCDSILNSKRSNINTVAVSSLHIMKEHPEIMQQIFGNKKKLASSKNILIKILNYLINFFIEKENFYLRKKIKNSCDVLILSNLINEKFCNDSKDFYFGDVERALNKSKLKTFTALRNFTDRKSSYLKENINRDKILFSERTDLFFELKLIFFMFLEFFNVRKIINTEIKNNKEFNLKSLISVKTIATNLRFANQVKQLVIRLKPKLLIIPFEGHAWERVVIKTVKKISKNVKVAAYQFSIKTKYQHSLFRPLKKEYNPDVLFTSGLITKKILQKKYNCKIKILGSNKFINKKKFTQSKKNFLILPEAFESEMKFLYDFAYQAAKKFPEHKFIYRCHPMSLNYLKNFDKTKPKNLIISKNSLIKDISLCKFTIFRGSASVFQSISSGLIPIYLDRKNELNINPLYSVLPERLVVKKPSDLNLIIKYKKKGKLLKKIKNYNKNYFMRLKPSVIKSII